MSFKFLEHEADVGIQVEGSTLEEAFQEGGKALFSYMVENFKDLKSEEFFEFKVTSEKIDLLFIEWLNELIYLRDADEVFLSEFKVQISKNQEYELKAIVKGETINLKKHKVNTEVKAATYHGLKYEKKGSKHILRCVLDI